MRGIETKRVVAMRTFQQRLALLPVSELHRFRRGVEITPQKLPQKTTRDYEMSSVPVEMEATGPYAFIFSERAQITLLQLRGLLETRAPHVYFTGC